MALAVTAMIGGPAAQDFAARMVIMPSISGIMMSISMTSMSRPWRGCRARPGIVGRHDGRRALGTEASAKMLRTSSSTTSTLRPLTTLSVRAAQSASVLPAGACASGRWMERD
jgi:hypothetical protein